MAQMSGQGLLAGLSAVAATPQKSSVRHGFVSILTASVWAILAGARSFTSIADRVAHDLAPALRATVGIRRIPPTPAI